MAATDRFPNIDDLLAPASRAVAVTPNDNTTLANVTKRIWVGGTGAVKLDTVGGDVGVIYSAVPAGTYLRVRATKIYSTGTTATLIVAEF